MYVLAIRLEDVKNMGITVSLDDFGTGFSSFARLRDLNIDIVKIDKQFIDNISVKKESNLISQDRAIEFLESKSGYGGIYEQKQREAIN